MSASPQRRTKLGARKGGGASRDQSHAYQGVGPLEADGYWSNDIKSQYTYR